jgi:hypothetical protein
MRASRGDRAADAVAAKFGSWSFLGYMSVLIVVWIATNAIAWRLNWDPYPFILLNLVFSTQASYAAPVILLAQNRSAERDRLQAEHDFVVNQRAGPRSTCCCVTWTSPKRRSTPSTPTSRRCRPLHDGGVGSVRPSLGSRGVSLDALTVVRRRGTYAVRGAVPTDVASAEEMRHNLAADSGTKCRRPALETHALMFSDMIHDE